MKGPLSKEPLCADNIRMEKRKEKQHQSSMRKAYGPSFFATIRHLKAGCLGIKKEAMTDKAWLRRIPQCCDV